MRLMDPSLKGVDRCSNHSTDLVKMVNSSGCVYMYINNLHVKYELCCFKSLKLCGECPLPFGVTVFRVHLFH